MFWHHTHQLLSSNKLQSVTDLYHALTMQLIIMSPPLHTTHTVQQNPNVWVALYCKGNTNIPHCTPYNTIICQSYLSLDNNAYSCRYRSKSRLSLRMILTTRPGNYIKELGNPVRISCHRQGEIHACLLQQFSSTATKDKPYLSLV